MRYCQGWGWRTLFGLFRGDTFCAMYRTGTTSGDEIFAAAVDTTTVADRIVSVIAEYTNYLFGVGGANIEDVYDAVQRAGTLTGVVAMHEFGAATMADGYARAGNRLGVVAATSGGGALNLIAALGESFDSRVSVLALVGQPPTILEGQGAFQDTSGGVGRLDAERLFASVSRYCAKPTRAADVDVALDKAIEAALSGGPAVLLLPKDIQQEAQSAAGNMARHTVRPRYSMDSRRFSEAATLIRSARGYGSVVVIAGPEVARADARLDLEAFAVAFDAPVVVTPDAKDAFPNRHPLYAGVAGVMGHPHVSELVASSRLCVLAGAQMPITARAGLDAVFASGLPMLSLGSEVPFVHTDVHLVGPLSRSLRDLAALVADRPPVRRLTRKRLRELTMPAATGPGVRYRDAIAALSARLEPGVDVVVDAGNTGASVVHHLPVPDDGRFLVALGMGGMGYSFGAGIGCALARGRRAFVIAGDGAYFMHGHEVRTAVEHQVPVTFVVFNNNAHAMCVTRERTYFSGDYSFNLFRPAHLGAGVAAMFPSLPTYSADTLADFEAALDDARTAAGPVFIELVCDPEEIPPFTPFIKEMSA